MTRLRIRFCTGALALLTLALISCKAFALQIPPKPAGYVHDQAGLLSLPVRLQLEQLLEQHDRQTSNQVVVATFPSLENESLEDFSIRLAQAWKPGTAARDNGVILLIFKNERQMRIEVGYGLEGVLTDAVSGQIIRNVIRPAFRSGDYDGGITAGVAAILKTIGSPVAGADSVSFEDQNEANAREQMAVLMKFFMVFAFLSLGMDALRYRGYAHEHRIHSDRYSFWEWWFRFGILLALLKIFIEILYYSSRGSGYRSSGGGSSGGGYSGGGGFSGGGGSFGGGGASGGW